MSTNTMTKAEKDQALTDALHEALVLAEIMAALTDGRRSWDSDELPCTWVGYLGECVFRVAQKIEGATA